MSSRTDALDVAQIIATPSCLAQYLAPKIWGQGAVYRADPWVIAQEQGVVDAIRDRENMRFVKTNAPSQIGKSMFDEVFVPFWTFGFWPDTRAILIGYSDGIAQRSGGMVRDLIKQYGPELFNIEIDPDYQSKGDWKIAGKQGGMLSVGIGSQITGRSGDLIIIGDIIKNMEEAGSKTTKDHHWEEWEGSIMTRLQPNSTVILAATRFADDDLSGRLDAKQREPDYEGFEWESYVFPAIAEPSIHDADGDNPDWRDALGRVRGEPLQTRFSKPGDEDPANWEQSYFYRLRRAKDPYAWSSIYQQEPTSPTGGMFPVESWTTYDPDHIPPLMGVRRAWDLAASEGEGDWTVGTKIGKTFDGDFLILDVVRERKSGVAVKQLVEQVASIDGVACPLIIERERTGAGKTILEFYAQALPLYQVLPGIPDGSKEDRARPASLLQQAGRLKLPRNRADGSPVAWVPAFIDELRKMMGDGRKGRHDDQIDTTAYAVNDMLDENITYMETTSLRFSHDRGLMAV
jgi:predicted phage terminase large subunit-like protein